LTRPVNTQACYSSYYTKQQTVFCLIRQNSKRRYFLEIIGQKKAGAANGRPDKNMFMT